MGNLLSWMGMMANPYGWDELGPIINDFVSIVLAILGSLAILFAIFIGIRMATATDEGKRKEAKQQILYTLIAIVVIGVLTAALRIVLPMTFTPESPTMFLPWVR